MNTIIRDKLIEPYFIRATSYDYILCKTNIIEKEGKTKGMENEVAIGYYSRLHGALLKIAKEKAGTKHEMTIREYIDQFNDNLEKFTNKIKI